MLPGHNMGIKWLLGATIVTGVALSVAVAAPEGPAANLKIFDAHLHYNQEPTPIFSLDKVQETFRRNRVGGIIANSRPNKGTHQLVDARSEDLWVVPFIRPYRTREDVWNWSNDPAIYDLIESEYKRGYYVGVGEFHIQGRAAEAPLVKKTVDFAVERNLYILAHCDETALVILYGHNPKAKIIWAHTGFSTPVPRVRELLDTYPTLIAELSYRGGITEGRGALAQEWRELFAGYADRFVIGSDTWIPERWISYDQIIATYRGWLAQLPPDQARLIAHGNAERLFKGKLPN